METAIPLRAAGSDPSIAVSDPVGEQSVPSRKRRGQPADKRTINLPGRRDVVTVEVWNSRNPVQIDRRGHSDVASEGKL